MRSEGIGTASVANSFKLLEDNGGKRAKTVTGKSGEDFLQNGKALVLIQLMGSEQR